MQLIINVNLRRLALALVILMPCAAELKEATLQILRNGENAGSYILQAGDPSLAEWKLPPLNIADQTSADHTQSDALIKLGRALFFDPKLSSDNSRSCASCHRPKLGWSDGRPTAVGLNGQPLDRATPSLYNSAYGTIFTWDGRASSLEEQALGPVYDPSEMGSSADELLTKLRSDEYYRKAFAEVFTDQFITEDSISRALASFERTLLVQNTRFDQWVAGDHNALTLSEIRGFGVFLDSERGSCATCHAPPNFTDDGFHNIGLASFSDPDPDLGRYNIRPVKLMRGAFKTPSLRNITLTAPYFHDGSAETLEDVVEHYQQGGVSKGNLSPEMKDIDLNTQDVDDLIAFLRAISITRDDESINMASEQ